MVYHEDERCIEWAESAMAGCKFRDDAQTIGIERDGELLAVAVFDTFSTTSCFLHLVSDQSKRWMTQEFMIRVFAFPFNQCGFHRINCRVAASNEASQKLVRHFGWVEEGRLREESEDGSDLIVFGMLRRECRWLPAGSGMLAQFKL